MVSTEASGTAYGAFGEVAASLFGEGAFFTELKVPEKFEALRNFGDPPEVAFGQVTQALVGYVDVDLWLSF